MNQHGTALQWNKVGFLLVGPPGCGKSSLALKLIARGAVLVADDQVLLQEENGRWTAQCPAAIKGKIHCRDTGLLNLASQEQTPLHLVLQSNLPAMPLSMPPALLISKGLPVIILDFLDPDLPQKFDTLLPRP